LLVEASPQATDADMHQLYTDFQNGAELNIVRSERGELCSSMVRAGDDGDDDEDE